MVSNLKRYKSLLGTVKSALLKEYRGVVLQKSVRVDFKKNLYEMSFVLNFEWDATNLIFYEQGTQVYLGIDLKQRPRVKLETATSPDLQASIWDWVYANLRNKGSLIPDDFEDDLGFPVDDIVVSQKEFFESDAFKKIWDTLESACTDFTMTSALRPGEWPTLKKRDILPVVIFDFDEQKESITYIERAYAESYRKNRQFHYLASVTRDVEEIALKAKPPGALFHSTYSSKYAGKYHI